MEDINKAMNSASSATTAAGQAGSEQYKVEDVLRQKIVDAYNSNQDIVKPLDVATTNYLGAPAAAREKYQNIFNPFQRENLVSQYTGTQALPMLSLSNILGSRMGRVEDTLGTGVRGFQAYAAAKQAEAQAQQQTYENLLKQYALQQPDTQVIEAGGRKLLINSQTGEIIKDLGYSGSGEGSGLGDLSWLFNNPSTSTLPEQDVYDDVTNDVQPTTTTTTTQPTTNWFGPITGTSDPLKKMQEEEQKKKNLDTLFGQIGPVNLSGVSGLKY